MANKKMNIEIVIREAKIKREQKAIDQKIESIKNYMMLRGVFYQI
jgi:hypothetical protein